LIIFLLGSLELSGAPKWSEEIGYGGICISFLRMGSILLMLVFLRMVFVVIAKEMLMELGRRFESD
jgi:hypothetical protein